MEKMIPLRALKDNGQHIYGQYFGTEGGEDKYRAKAPRTAILFSDEYSTVIGCGVVPAVSPGDKFATAKAIVEGFGDKFETFLYDPGVWSWLSLLYWKDVLGSDFSDGKPVKLNETAAYFVRPKNEIYARSADRFRQFRHRLWGPAFMYHKFGDLARVCLTGPISALSDPLDALMHQNIAEKGVLEAMDLMYFDEATGKLTGKVKSSTRLEGELREGSIRDFLVHVRQIGCTHGIHRLTPDTILEGLPVEEFGPFVDAAWEKLRMAA